MVEELTRVEKVAIEVTTGLLRCPDVAFKATGDDCPDDRPAVWGQLSGFRPGRIVSTERTGSSGGTRVLVAAATRRWGAGPA